MLLSMLAERTRKYIRGSADDIGWLQRDPYMPPVTDGTRRFMEILDSIRFGVHKLPNTLVYLLIPGLGSNHVPLYFVNTKTHLTNLGLTCYIAKIHSEASVEKNARDVKQQIEEIYRTSQKRVMLLGHSKGGLDAAGALSMYWFDLKDKVAGLALAQSPYGGTPLASDIARQGQLGDLFLRAIVFLVFNIIKGDVRALEDLTYEKRREFLRKHSLPKEIPVVSFHTEAEISSAAMATLTHMANIDLCLTGRHEVIVPSGAAMAATACVVQTKYGEKSDGLVTRRDAEVPGSVVVRPSRKLDHQWLVFSSVKDSSYEASSSQVCEALLQLLLETGQSKNWNFA
ncbi:uncharacterized protein LOC141585968 isoform X2 [Silene latifolia]|uniref:uncharacterized protein LOC141585968 isoform X2 n=1 Tax=Silene latifolia TaxID=37657 RepID=UPI003D782DA9